MNANPAEWLAPAVLAVPGCSCGVLYLQMPVAAVPEFVAEGSNSDTPGLITGTIAIHGGSFERMKRGVQPLSVVDNSAG